MSRVCRLLYGDDPLHCLLDGNLDIENAGVIPCRDALLGDILTETPRAEVGGLRAVDLTSAGDGEMVILGGDLDVGAAEAGHLHGDGIALVGLIDLGAGLYGRLRGATITSIVEEGVEEGIKVGVGIAGHEAEHAVFSLFLVDRRNHSSMI